MTCHPKCTIVCTPQVAAELYRRMVTATHCSGVWKSKRVDEHQVLVSFPLFDWNDVQHQLAEIRFELSKIKTAE